LQNNNNKVKMV